MSNYRQPRGLPGRPAMRGANRAQLGMARNVAPPPSGGPSNTTNHSGNVGTDTRGGANGDDDMDFRRFVTPPRTSRRAGKANAQAAPASRVPTDRPQARKVTGSPPEPDANYSNPRLIGRRRSELFDSVEEEIAHYFPAPTRAPPRARKGSITRDGPQYPERGNSDDGDTEFAETAAKLEKYYVGLEKELYPKGEGTLFPSNAAKTEWADPSDEDVGFTKTAGDLEGFYNRNNLLQNLDPSNNPPVDDPSPVDPSYQSPNWKEIDAWDSDAEFTRAAVRLDNLYTSMGLGHVFRKKPRIPSPIAGLHPITTNMGSRANAPETEYFYPEPPHIPPRRLGQGLDPGNRGSSSRGAEPSSGKAQVKVTSEGSPYIERLKPRKAPEKATSVRRPHIERPRHEKAPQKAARIAENARTKYSRQQNAPHEQVQAQVPAPVLTEYEEELIASMRVPGQAQESQGSPSQRGSPSNEQAKQAASASGSESSRETPAGPRGYFNRRVGSYLFVFGIFIWLLHNTAIVIALPVPCPRHIILSPVGTACNISSSIASIPKAVTCSVFPCRSTERARLRAIDTLAAGVEKDYATYKAFTTAIEILGEPVYLDKLMERFEAAKALPHYGRSPGDPTVDYIRSTHQQYLKLNSSLKSLFIRIRKTGNFTSDNLIGYLEYLTNQSPHDLQDQLNLPRGWNANVIMDDRRNGERFIKLRGQNIKKEIIKHFNSLLHNVEDLDHELRNAVRLTRLLVDKGVHDLVLGPTDIQPISRSITDLKGFIAWCIPKFSESGRGQASEDDDSDKERLYSIESAWVSVLSFDSDAVGKYKPYKRFK